MTAKCLSVTHLAYIKRAALIDALQEFPEDYVHENLFCFYFYFFFFFYQKEKFCYFKDQIYLYNNIPALKILCFSCKEPDHMISTCRLMHYVPPKTHILKRHICSEDQERNDNFKRSLLKFNAKSHLVKIQKDAYAFVKSQNFNEDSRTVHESDLSGNEDENSGSNSSLLEINENNKKQLTGNRKRKSIAQNSGTLKALNFTLSKLDPTVTPKINEDRKKKLSMEKVETSPKFNRFEKFNKLHIETNVLILLNKYLCINFYIYSQNISRIKFQRQI